MSADKDEGLPEEIGEELEKEGLAEPVLVHDRTGWHQVRRVTRAGLLAILVIAVIGFAALWIWRKPLADNVIANELEKRGVQATYTIDKVGLHNQQISNIRIGDPEHPDLVAQTALIQMRVKWNGSVQVYRIVTRGAHLNGRLLKTGKVSWGQIDKLLPPPSGKPFRLPDVVLDVADSTIRLNTPYGRLGFAIVGSGNLTGGFKGRLATAAHHLDVGACSLDRLKSNVAIGVVARRPRVLGPVAASSFNCPASRMTMIAPRIDVDSNFAEAFTDFNGKGKLAVASFTAGDNGLANLVANLSFKGSPTSANGGFDLSAQRARLATIYADRTRLNGKYNLQARKGTLAVAANYGASSARLSGPLVAQLIGALEAAHGTPIEPIARAMGAAVRNTVSNFDAEGRLVLVNYPGGGGVRIQTANVSGPNGARAKVAGRDGLNYYWPKGYVRIDTDIQMAGGGLPTAQVSLRQPRNGGPMTGTADVAPYRAGNSRLALDTIRFTAAPDGSTSVRTIALMDGPVPGGFVRGLRVPVDAEFGGPAGFRFGRTCLDARFASFQMGSLKLGAARLPVCPTGPAIAYQGPGGALQVGALLRNPKFAGSLGNSPVALSAAFARLMRERFQVGDFAMRIGKADAPVLLNATALEGNYSGTGTLSGGRAIIGRVPLAISEAAGKWRMVKGGVGLTGAMTVADRADPVKFYPLRSDNVNFLLANNRIEATGLLKHPASGTPVTNVTIHHNLDSGEGNAVLDVPGIRFGNSLQPEELTPITQGIIALVNGGLSGQGQIAWNGTGKVSSTGDFRVTDMDLAAPFGPVTGMNGTIHFTDLLGLETGPGQVVTLGSVNPGILVEDGVMHYQLLPDRLVKIERGEWPFMGGRLILHETILNFNKPTAKRLTFEVVGLDAHTFVGSMGFSEIDAAGVFDGVLPMIFDENGGRIVGGRLDSREGGGFLQYNGVVNKANLGTMGNIAFEALRDLRFKSMIIRLDGDLAGEFVTRSTIDGVGLGSTGTQRIIRGLLKKIPLKLNLTIRGPFRGLIATAKAFRDPRQVIEEVLPRPLDQVPGITTEVIRKNEENTQTQTPVQEKVETNPPTPTTK
ncbi:intermembrane phospholipid transport protein YdbH family protein [Sphingomonas alba]|uniref:YdbH domain-containing protein n=1 Tax=Sphingomonas alba TaxID=2908208 RepID=A0ABT0RKD6_9SPHN|nr:YdbH domain-containing protein [Sphingomonas alba]MCL6683065.1 YdbH domain-containing protein [Sphingomonas alba]